MSGPPAKRVGIVLSNIGSPAEPMPKEVREFLVEFLGDRDVLRVPWLFGLFLRYGGPLHFRAPEAAAKYKRIWTAVGAPLLAISTRQAEALEDHLRTQGITAYLRTGMRYGRPSLADAVMSLKRKNCRKILLLPMYPQYSRATTGSTLKLWNRLQKRHRDIRFEAVEPYYKHPGYIQALAASVRDAWRQGGRAERLLISFHGLPASSVREGDPYYTQCIETARLVVEALSLEEGAWTVSFQSRFGRGEWLQPYTDDTLEQWASKGVKSVDVLCPGFAADGLETLYETRLEMRDIFRESGGDAFRYIPALNERADHIALMADLVRPHILQ
jgi:protoporphyrin/coproporphyrin ferrochelatase